jgi:glycosyltransferase involved in cell wall biosynthesis
VPTGVPLNKFTDGDGATFRARLRIPAEAFVVGHLGRLAPEKNLQFLSEAVAGFMRHRQHVREVHFLIIGSGSSEHAIRTFFNREGLGERLHIVGVLQSQQLADALQAMNLFAFASTSETQGMVLIEAMATGLPVVALDASGAREVVKDGENGRLLHELSTVQFGDALQWVAERSPEQMLSLKQAALDTAQAYSMPRMADRAIACFKAVIDRPIVDSAVEERRWEEVRTLIRTEWDIIKGVVKAGDAALGGSLFSTNKN